MGMNLIEVDLINNYLKDAVSLNEKILLQIQYILDYLKEGQGYEAEKIRRSCKQLNLVSDVLKDIIHQTKEQQLTLSKVFIPITEIDFDSIELNVKEHYKKQISEEIFHTIGQTLFSLYLSLYKLQELQFRDEIKNQLTNLSVIVDETIKKVKDSAFEIYPLILEDLGLVATVKSYLAYLSQKKMFNIPYKVKGDIERFPIQVEIQLFRLGQDFFHELMENSKTSELSIIFRESDAEIDITINGEGKTFLSNSSIEDSNWRKRLSKLRATFIVHESSKQYQYQFTFYKAFF
ncbi:hypothetical protein SM124_19795 [Bacillus sp. 31A1R]|uniref:Histidine kinase n=1 Tax=Robertmurraya mangrovi TaxID=3098077 RepID=A0ABU5J3I1_9BACI|nr:hypothetical protein [Bacillus sp. 31A1R]MDZ5473967.1 hypothetical protein [Bacillus sp. 31A1R]